MFLADILGVEDDLSYADDLVQIGSIVQVPLGIFEHEGEDIISNYLRESLLDARWFICRYHSVYR